ncbi:phage tail tube assembly chaperone [Leuconostoc pseudomesenteroides]|uniref:phage tail tube assembly chaperone n=1 Tax=Leuconostoc pseudomesenteroides TaxID=33968 RepID=UPI00345F10CF
MAVNTEKIKLNKFGISKTVNVRTTFGLLEKLDELDITLLELQDTENAEYIDIRRNNLKSARLKMEFVQVAFELSDEDIENIKNSISPEQFGEAFEYVTLRMRGVTDENYNVLVAEAKREQEEQEADETDPKEDSVE